MQSLRGGRAQGWLWDSVWAHVAGVKGPHRKRAKGGGEDAWLCLRGAG